MHRGGMHRGVRSVSCQGRHIQSQGRKEGERGGRSVSQKVHTCMHTMCIHSAYTCMHTNEGMLARTGCREYMDAQQLGGLRVRGNKQSFDIKLRACAEHHA